MVYATLLLALGAMPLRTTSQFFRRQSNIQAREGNQGPPAQHAEEASGRPSSITEKGFESLSPNSFLTVTAGNTISLGSKYWWCLERESGKALCTRQRRHHEKFGVGASTQELGRSKLVCSERRRRRKEEQRRAAGEKAARDATMNAVNCGGEFHHNAIGEPKIGIGSIRERIDYWSLSVRIAEHHCLIDEFCSGICRGIEKYDVKIEGKFNFIWHSSDLRISRSVSVRALPSASSCSKSTWKTLEVLPCPQTWALQGLLSNSGTSAKGNSTQMPPAPPPMGPQTEAESYSDQELLLMKEFLKGGELLSSFWSRH